jgi:predicted transcriptional regulator
MAKIISVSLPPDLVLDLDREAARRARSRSWVVAEAVRSYLGSPPAPYSETGASFERGRDLTLIEGLALGYEQRAGEAEALWEEAWRFAPACEPFVRVFAAEQGIAEWKQSTDSTCIVSPSAGAVRKGAVETRVALVCRLLNRERVQYVLIGGAAAALHGVIRPTKDVDVLLEPTVENAQRAFRALQGLAFGVARDLDPQRVAAAPFTIVGDVPRVDLLTVACGVTYDEAIRTCVPVRLSGVVVPLADIDTLIRAKRTGRARDLGDIEELERLKELRDSRPR